jgi:hypothetical protein
MYRVDWNDARDDIDFAGPRWRVLSLYSWFAREERSVTLHNRGQLLPVGYRLDVRCAMPRIIVGQGSILHENVLIAIWLEQCETKVFEYAVGIYHRNYHFTCPHEAAAKSIMKATTYATIKASAAKIEVSVNVWYAFERFQLRKVLLN